MSEKLNENDIRALAAASKHRFGYFPEPDHRGFAPYQHRKRMVRFVASGFATGPNAHGDFEITDSGRAASKTGAE